MRGISTNGVIDFRVSNASEVLNEGGHGPRPPKECEGLIDEVSAKVERLSRCRLRLVFPCALERGAVAVETSRVFFSSVKNILRWKTKGERYLLRLEFNKIAEGFRCRLWKSKKATEGKKVGVVATVLKGEYDKAFGFGKNSELLCFFERRSDRLVHQHCTPHQSLKLST